MTQRNPISLPRVASVASCNIPRRSARQDVGPSVTRHVSYSTMSDAKDSLTVKTALENLCKGNVSISNVTKDVESLLAWITHQDSALIIPKRYYQRNSETGWSEEQKGLFLAAVLADRAKAPIVINKVLETCARVMDGGHRINALKDFKNGKVPILVKHEGSSIRIFFSGLDKKSRITFHRRCMNVLIYSKLSLHDEIREYLSLNSGLPFSIGEKFGAVKKINVCVNVASLLQISTPDPKGFRKDDVARRYGWSHAELVRFYMKKILNVRDADRMEDLHVLTICSWNLWFRKLPSISRSYLFINTTDSLLDLVARFDKAKTSIQDGDASCVEGSKILLKRLCETKKLYDFMTGKIESEAKTRTGLTEYRRVFVCMLAVSEIEDIDHEAFKLFIEKQAENNTLGFNLSSCRALGEEEILQITNAYRMNVEHSLEDDSTSESKSDDRDLKVESSG